MEQLPLGSASLLLQNRRDTKDKMEKKELSGSVKRSDRRDKRWRLQCQIFSQPHQQTVNDLSKMGEKAFTVTLVSPVYSSLFLFLCTETWERKRRFSSILFKEQTDGYPVAYLVKWWKNKQLTKISNSCTGTSLPRKFLIKIRKEKQWSTVPGSNKN